MCVGDGSKSVSVNVYDAFCVPVSLWPVVAVLVRLFRERERLSVMDSVLVSRLFVTFPLCVKVIVRVSLNVVVFDLL